jgi:hypothetical protein
MTLAYPESVPAKEMWVVKHERYDAPSYVLLYGPFGSGEEAAEWAAGADLPDFHVALRLVPPGELHQALAALQRNGQLTPDGRSLSEVSSDEASAIERWADSASESGHSA